MTVDRSEDLKDCTSFHQNLGRDLVIWEENIFNFD